MSRGARSRRGGATRATRAALPKAAELGARTVESPPDGGTPAAHRSRFLAEWLRLRPDDQPTETLRGVRLPRKGRHGPLEIGGFVGVHGDRQGKLAPDPMQMFLCGRSRDQGPEPAAAPTASWPQGRSESVFSSVENGMVGSALKPVPAGRCHAITAAQVILCRGHGCPVDSTGGVTGGLVPFDDLRAERGGVAGE